MRWSSSSVSGSRAPRVAGRIPFAAGIARARSGMSTLDIHRRWRITMSSSQRRVNRRSFHSRLW